MYFKQFCLEKYIHFDPEQEALAKCILYRGLGNHPKSDFNKIKLPEAISCDNSIEEVFKDYYANQNDDGMKERDILASLNKAVRK